MAEYDIVIVGGGMVGLSLAAALTQQCELNIALVKQQPLLSAAEVDFDPVNQRFSAINAASEQFLKDLGVWARIVDWGISPYHRMVVWDATGQGEIEFDSRDIARPHLGHIIANSVLQSVLYEQINGHPCVHLFCPAEPAALIQDQHLMGLNLADGKILVSKLLAGADGANSWVRDQAGISFRQWSYQQCALTATVSTEKSHQHTAWQRFLPSGPLAFLPLANPQHCSIVWTVGEEQANYLLTLDEIEFNQKLAESFDWRLGEVQVLGKRTIFPLQMRHVKQYVKPRLALLGDAAHILHPLAGQGLNLGFADAKCLADILIAADKTGSDIGDFELLRSYERARKAKNWEMITAVESLKRLFSNDSIRLSMLRNMGLNLTNKFQPIKSMIMRRAMGI